MATKYQIAEQVMRLYHDGDVSAGSGLTIQEVKLLVCQVSNTLIKAEYYSTDIQPIAESRPGVIGFYPNIPVMPYRNTSMIEIPVQPVKLPMNMGLWDISASSDPLSGYSFIPIPSGAWAMRADRELLCSDLKQFGYVWEGRGVYFTENLIQHGIQKVDVKMIVVDAAQLNDYEPLPIPADMEAQLITEVYKLVAARGTTDKVVDSAREHQARPDTSRQ